MRTLHRFAASTLALAAMACALPLLTAQPTSAAQLSPPQRPQPVPHALPAADLLDINTATPEQLNALPGFGSAYTRRVIAGRPYSAKNQLVTRGVLPKSAYDLVSSRIVAHRPSR
jgi:DNA uptake protein ComE-like DNA-binding protein